LLAFLFFFKKCPSIDFLTNKSDQSSVSHTVKQFIANHHLLESNMFLRSRQQLPTSIDTMPHGHARMHPADWNDMDSTDKDHFWGFCKKNALRIDQAEISRIDESLQKGLKVCLRFQPNFSPTKSLRSHTEN